MSGIKMVARNRPDHVWRQGDTVFLDGDPMVIASITPQRGSPVFLDWEQRVEFELVDVVLERFDGNPA